MAAPEPAGGTSPDRDEPAGAETPTMQSSGSSPRSGLWWQMGLSTLAVGLLLLCLRGPDVTLPWALHPTGRLHYARYALLYFATAPARELLTLALSGMHRVILRCEEQNESDGETKAPPNSGWGCLVLSTAIDFLCANHLAAFLADGVTERRLRSFGFANGPLAFVVVMYLNDIAYYPVQVAAHGRGLYPRCRGQLRPRLLSPRNSAAAAGLHPLEQVVGSLTFLASLRATSGSIGLHAGTAWCATFAWVVMNIVNHLPFDSPLHLPLLYPVAARDLRMHRRSMQCNYGVFTSLGDRAFGTYRPYTPPGGPAPEPKAVLWYERPSPYDRKAKEEPPAGPLDAVPSHWSLFGLAAALALAAVAVEVCEEGRLPPPADSVSLVHPALFLFGLATACAAAQAGVLEPESDVRRARNERARRYENPWPGPATDRSGWKGIWKVRDPSPVRPPPERRKRD